MQTHYAFCSACDRPVRVALTRAPVHGGQPMLEDGPELVCLEFGEQCTGEFCPMFGLPSILMGVRLARSDLSPETWRTVQAPCEGCNSVQELQVLDRTHAHCPACGTINQFLILRLDDGAYVAAGRATGVPAQPPAPPQGGSA
jgi:hypothetical protein